MAAGSPSAPRDPLRRPARRAGGAPPINMKETPPGFLLVQGQLDPVDGVDAPLFKFAVAHDRGLSRAADGGDCILDRLRLRPDQLFSKLRRAERAVLPGHPVDDADQRRAQPH